MVLPTPTFLQEAISASHIAVWGEPQYSRFGMFVFTFFFGFLGLHHVMLRSPLTGLMFFFGNALTLGYWWYYDLFQIAFTSEDDLNKFGLGFPFFIETGIAVGMWEGGTLRGKGIHSESNPVTKYGYERYGSGAAPGPAAPGPAATGPPATGPAATGPPSTGPPSTGPPSTGPPSTGPAAPAPATAGPYTQKGGAPSKYIGIKKKPTEGKPYEKKDDSTQGRSKDDSTQGSSKEDTKQGTPEKKLWERDFSPPAFNAEAYNQRKRGDGSLKETAGLFAESVLKVYLQWFLSTRGKQRPKEYDWDNVPPSAWITFFFILACPFEVISSAIAGDMWACFFHCISIFPFGFLLFPVIFVRSIFVTIYTILFPMEVFINGVTRPFPFVQLYTTVDIDGRSENIQRSKINAVDIDANYRAFQPFIEIYKQGIGLAEGCLAYVPLAVGGAAGQALKRFGDAAIKTAKVGAMVASRATPLGAAASVATTVAKGILKGGERELPVQKGGGSSSAGSSDTMSLGVLAAVVVGGLLLGIGRNVVQGNNDSPPLPRRI